MSNKLTVLTIVFLVIVPLIGIFLWIDYQNLSTRSTEDKDIESVTQEEMIPLVQQEDSGKGESSIESTQQDCINCEPEEEKGKTKTLKQAGWIPPWDYNNGIESLRGFKTEFDNISPVTFSINSDGSLNPRLDTKLQELREITEYKNISIIPTISDFDSDRMKNILNDEKNRDKHINAIVNVVEKNNYDGIDLDYEAISRESKEPFFIFLEELSSRLDSKNKILSVTVLPKWGDDVVYTSLAETREVQDYERIAKYSDQLRIMTYDFTHPRDPKPGPIAPTNWVERVLEYTTDKVQNDKIWLGIHLYSYEWVLENDQPHADILNVNSYTYQQLQDSIFMQEGIDTKYDEDIQEGMAEYPCNGNHCKLYYATPESVKQRQNLANKYKIAGVTYWRLGQEGDIIR